MNLFAARITMVGAAVSLVVMAAGLGIVLRGALASRLLQDPRSASGAIAATRPHSVPVDHFGDPLPKYARARMGTVRFNEGSVFPRRAVYAPDGKSLITAWSSRPMDRSSPRLPSRRRLPDSGPLPGSICGTSLAARRYARFPRTGSGSCRSLSHQMAERSHRPARSR
jgi:hypothetical protein